MAGHSSPTLPRKSARFGIGKEIGGAIYIHRQYAEVIGDRKVKAEQQLPSGFKYTVVKYNYKTGAISFIHSPDFDTSTEPTVGDLITVRSDGTSSFRRKLSDPYIYHHKWLFVGDDYLGFDIASSKKRSRAIFALSNVDRKRIGKKSYWESHVLPLLASEIG